MRTRLGESRYLTNPSTGEKLEASVIRDEVYVPALTEAPYDGGEWGKYVFGAWLEEDSFEPCTFYISFPYWRNGRFAGQYSLRAEPSIIRALFAEIQSRGWLDK